MRAAWSTAGQRASGSWELVGLLIASAATLPRYQPTLNQAENVTESARGIINRFVDLLGESMYMTQVRPRS